MMVKLALLYLFAAIPFVILCMRICLSIINLLLELKWIFYPPLYYYYPPQFAFGIKCCRWATVMEIDIYKIQMDFHRTYVRKVQRPIDF